jgi:hypothetical protein
MQMSGKQYNKLVRAAHDWTVSYIDAVSNKEVKFTCSNAMKRSHEIMMRSSPYVKEVMFKKGI